MTKRWFDILNKRKIVAVLFMDFKKAFDGASHLMLLKSYQHVVFGELYDYLKEYLTSQTQFTKIYNNATSVKSAVEFGVPQGSLLGPTCFKVKVTVNNMTKSVCDIKNDSELDSTAFEKGSTVDEAMSKIQSTANNLFDYSCKNLLTIHPDVRYSFYPEKNLYGPLN